MVSGYRTPIFLYSDLHGKRRKAGHTDPPLLFYFYRDRGVRNIESLYSRSTYEGGQREKKNDVSLARPRFGGIHPDYSSSPQTSSIIVLTCKGRKGRIHISARACILQGRRSVIASQKFTSSRIWGKVGLGPHRWRVPLSTGVAAIVRAHRTHVIVAFKQREKEGKGNRANKLFGTADMLVRSVFNRTREWWHEGESVRLVKELWVARMKSLRWKKCYNLRF